MVAPTATNELLPYVTAVRRRLGAADARKVQFAPSLEVRIVPESPTATKSPLPKATPYKSMFGTGVTESQGARGAAIRLPVDRAAAKAMMATQRRTNPRRGEGCIAGREHDECHAEFPWKSGYFGKRRHLPW